jgi:hypothetical protein
LLEAQRPGFRDPPLVEIPLKERAQVGIDATVVPRAGMQRIEPDQLNCFVQRGRRAGGGFLAQDVAPAAAVAGTFFKIGGAMSAREVVFAWKPLRLAVLAASLARLLTTNDVRPQHAEPHPVKEGRDATGAPTPG